jgi:hypothetical protein
MLLYACRVHVFFKRVSGVALRNAVTILYKVVRSSPSGTYTMWTFFHGEDSGCRIYRGLRGRDVYDKERLEDKAQLYTRQSIYSTSSALISPHVMVYMHFTAQSSLFQSSPWSRSKWSTGNCKFWTSTGSPTGDPLQDGQPTTPSESRKSVRDRVLWHSYYVCPVTVVAYRKRLAAPACAWLAQWGARSRSRPSRTTALQRGHRDRKSVTRVKRRYNG